MTQPTHIPHPWHGLSVGDDAPDVVNTYIEMTPSDAVKYELDKQSGLLKVDRPRQLSSQLPTIYGFIPRTFCGDRVGQLSDTVEDGDHDPLDVCVISERPIDRSQILLTARIVGGLHMVDGGEADDKIIAIIEGDRIWGDVDDISGVPEAIVEKLRHYFLTYKMFPGDTTAEVSIDEAYGADHAKTVLQAAIDDYDERFET